MHCVQSYVCSLPSLFTRPSSSPYSWLPSLRPIVTILHLRSVDLLLDPAPTDGLLLTVESSDLLSNEQT